MHGTAKAFLVVKHCIQLLQKMITFKPSGLGKKEMHMEKLLLLLLLKALSVCSVFYIHH